MLTVGLILARGSSKGIPNKNIRHLNGVPLICHSLRVLHRCKFLNQIWVSTDDTNISSTVLNSYPTTKIHKRSKVTSSDSSSSISAIKEFLADKLDIDIVFLVQCTSPLIHEKYLSEAYKMFEKENYDSVFSIKKEYKLRWTRSQSGCLVTVNFDPRNRPRRQDMPGDIVESGHFYATRKDVIIDDGLLQGGDKIGFVEIPQEMCLELDEEWEWDIAECLIKKHISNYEYQF